MHTGLSETYLYWFMIPFFNLLAALRLSKAETEQEKVIAQYHERRFDFCRNCSNRKTDLYKGMICGITDEKPDFVNICKDFKMRDSYKPEAQKPAPSKMMRGLILFVIFAGLQSAFSFIVSLANFRGIDTIIVPLLVLIVLWVLIYFVYHQRFWAILAYPATIILLSTINAVQSRGIDIEDFLIRLIPLIPVVILIWGAMPAWRYIAPKKNDPMVLLEGIGEAPEQTV